MSAETKQKINWGLLVTGAIFFITNTVYLTNLATHIQETAERAVNEITGMRSDFKEMRKEIQDLQVRTTLLEHQKK